MKFIHDDFLLETPQARRLYHEHAAPQPIIDYHCHLPPAEIAEDKRWSDIAELWLGGDHYKWRAMRSVGINENFCTGDATPWEKFAQYAGAMPQLLRNPLYHWSHLELARFFAIDDQLLGPATARDFFDRCNDMLAQPGFSARGFMQRSNVEVVCTTDDPVDSLEHHRAIAADKNFKIRVLPTWRPDKVLLIDRPEVFTAWLGALEQAASMAITSLDDLMSALQKRHDFFADSGCRLSDRGLETIWAEDCPRSEAAAIFAKARAGQSITSAEAVSYKSYLLHELAVMDAAKSWTMQIHYGALRSNNSRMLHKIGPDTGFDSIGDWPVASAMARHFDRLDAAGNLPKTIIYNLNPRDNEVIATMLGNFQDGITAGKMQLGSGWWFNDQLDGMTRQIEALSQLGVLARFVGMLTDSRSFLSYTRHEYFRRLLCNILGRDIQRGLVPDDIDLVGGLVADISYRNARDYFGFTAVDDSASAVSFPAR
ncbi:MAG: glucuronate isomerase [Verrucomicrobia bacterium]|nr:glucuronate isomerase [Verrucomicrobiota bacterium]